MTRLPSMTTEADILAEAEAGEVVCVLYTGTNAPSADGIEKDRLCHALADADRLRLSRIEGSRTSPFGMKSRWIRKT